MSLLWPRMMRAARGLASSRPRWMPSASHRSASRRSSLTISGTPNWRHSATSSLACSWRRAASPDLSRYCTAATPPVSAASTCFSNCSVSAVSGVMAYTPPGNFAESGIAFRLSILGPEKTLGDVLPHAGTEGGLQRFIGEVVGIAHRGRHILAIRQRGCDGRGERAAGTVIAAGQAVPGIGLHVAVGVVGAVQHAGRGFVGAGDEHVFAAGTGQGRGAGGEIHVVLVRLEQCQPA